MDKSYHFRCVLTRQFTISTRAHSNTSHSYSDVTTCSSLRTKYRKPYEGDLFARCELRKVCANERCPWLGVMTGPDWHLICPAASVLGALRVHFSVF